MKKINSTILAALFGAGALVAGCQGKDPIAVSSVVVAPETVTLQIGGSQTLTATVLPADADNRGVVWAGTNDAVATVNAAGLVTAVSAGTATITATAADGSSKQGSCTVTVLAAPTVGVTSSLSLTEVNEIKYTEAVDAEGKPTKAIALEVAATRGIGALKLSITTENEIINAALTQMGLAGQFDLATLPAAQAEALKGIFGAIPTGDQVKGKDKVTIDLSAIPVFVVGGIAGGIEQFDIAVEATDADHADYPGTALVTKAETLKLKFTDDRPAPEVKITSTLSLTEVNTFKYSEVDKDNDGKPDMALRLTVTAPRGIASLKLHLVTDNPAINLALNSEQIGLAEQFDLAQLDAAKIAVIDSFFAGGIPTGDKVEGQKEVTLDITAILGLVTDVPGGVNRFDIAVEAADVADDTIAQIVAKETLKLKFLDE